jgi:hypothetical protein
VLTILFYMTSEATAAVTPTPVTVEPTQPQAANTALPLAVELPLGLLYGDSIDSGDLSVWQIATGWSLVVQDTGQALQCLTVSKPMLKVRKRLL